MTTLTNTNKLIRRYDGCDGIKTGSTGEAGYCMAASARRGGMRLVTVVLGASSGSERFQIASDMMDYGFAAYRLYPVAEKGAKVRGAMPVEGGSQDSVPLLLGDDLTLLVKKGGEAGVTLSAELPAQVTAPVQAGDVVGWVSVLKDGSEAARIPVVAAEDVAVRSLGDALRHVFDRWGFQ